jgi:hypothetical protein
MGQQNHTNPLPIDDTGEATAMHPRLTPKVTNFP